MHGSLKGKSNQQEPQSPSGGVSPGGGQAQASPAMRLPSWQSQTSGEENSWNDSPVTPRKNSATRVSFKRDEELSEIHDIVSEKNCILMFCCHVLFGFFISDECK